MEILSFDLYKFILYLKTFRSNFYYHFFRTVFYKIWCFADRASQYNLSNKPT